MKTTTNRSKKVSNVHFIIENLNNINEYSMNIHNNYSLANCTKKFYKNVKSLCNIFILKKLSKTAKMPIIHNFHCFLNNMAFCIYFTKRL